MISAAMPIKASQYFTDRLTCTLPSSPLAQQEERATGSLDSAKALADQAIATKNDMAAYDILEHAARRSRSTVLRTNPHVNFHTTVKVIPIANEGAGFLRTPS